MFKNQIIFLLRTGISLIFGTFLKQYPEPSELAHVQINGAAGLLSNLVHGPSIHFSVRTQLITVDAVLVPDFILEEI